MTSALDGFLHLECSDWLAARLRAEVAASQGVGYDRFELDLFDLELFYAEDRVRVTEAAALGYEDAEVSLADFLAGLPDVPPGPRMPDRPRRVFVMPPPPEPPA